MKFCYDCGQLVGVFHNEDGYELCVHMNWHGTAECEASGRLFVTNGPGYQTEDSTERKVTPRAYDPNTYAALGLTIIHEGAR